MTEQENLIAFSFENKSILKHPMEGKWTTTQHEPVTDEAVCADGRLQEIKGVTDALEKLLNVCDPFESWKGSGVIMLAGSVSLTLHDQICGV